MRAKFIYEKFVEDSDPISDMGIGNSVNLYKKSLELTKGDRNNLDDWVEYMKSTYGKTIYGKFIEEGTKRKTKLIKLTIFEMDSTFNNFNPKRKIYIDVISDINDLNNRKRYFIHEDEDYVIS